MNRKIIRKITIRLLKEAIASLYIQDKRNIDMRVNEMNICARLAHHLQNRIQEYVLIYDGYFVDTEYNRSFGGEKKCIQYNDGKLHSVRCDLLIHSRGLKNPDNILALEMKKEKVDKNVKDDHDRLENIVKSRTENTPKDAVCDTILGVFLEIGSSACKLTCYWFDTKLVSFIEEIKIEDIVKLNNIE